MCHHTEEDWGALIDRRRALEAELGRDEADVDVDPDSDGTDPDREDVPAPADD
jgi:hypothetical protein